MNRIGILGGTFNPIHNAHISLAKYCMNEISLDKVIFIPTFTPPHKESDNLASGEHRLNMCRLACGKIKKFEVSDIEIKRQGRSYSYITISSLKELYPDDELCFIMGADMFLSLQSWKNPETIFRKALLAVIPRNDCDYEDLNVFYRLKLHPMGARAIILPRPVERVSSTYIRENIRNKAVISEFLNSEVYEYIIKNHLYTDD